MEIYYSSVLEWKKNIWLVFFSVDKVQLWNTVVLVSEKHTLYNYEDLCHLLKISNLINYNMSVL